MFDGVVAGLGATAVVPEAAPAPWLGGEAGSFDAVPPGTGAGAALEPGLVGADALEPGLLGADALELGLVGADAFEPAPAFSASPLAVALASVWLWAAELALLSVPDVFVL